MSTVLILIQRQSLQCYYPDSDMPVACMLPLTVLRDLEVVNEGELDTQLGHILRPVPPKSQMQAMILIDEGICFSSVLETGKEEEIKKTLINDVPFLHVAGVVVPLGTGPVFVTTNQDYYEAVGRVLESHGYMVLGVYPWTVVGHVQAVGTGETFSMVSVKRLFDAGTALKNLGFSYHNQISVTTVIAPVSGGLPPKKNKKGWIIFFVITLVYAGFMLVMMFVRS